MVRGLLRTIVCIIAVFSMLTTFKLVCRELLELLYYYYIGLVVRVYRYCPRKEQWNGTCEMKLTLSF